MLDDDEEDVGVVGGKEEEGQENPEKKKFLHACVLTIYYIGRYIGTYYCRDALIGRST